MGLTIFPSSIVLIEISCVRNLNNDYYYLYLFACIQSFIHSVRLEYMICMKRGEGGQKRGLNRGKKVHIIKTEKCTLEWKRKNVNGVYCVSKSLVHC